MKKFMLEFIRRGLVACGFGPIVLAVVYLVLREHAGVQMLPVSQVCVGIISLFFLAFIAGGMKIGRLSVSCPIFLIQNNVG